MRAFRVLLGVVFATSFLLPASLAGEHPFTNEFKIPHPWILVHVELVDLDQDGDLDVLALEQENGGPGLGRVVWHQNKKNGSKFTLRDIDSTLMTPVDASVGDVDGDGDLDIIVTGNPRHAKPNGGVQWYENLGKAKVWEIHHIHHNGLHGQVELADMDGDGDLDAVLAAPKALVIYSNEDGKGKTWSEPNTIVSNQYTMKLSPFVLMDMDGDKDVDIVGRYKKEFAWFENTGGAWKRKTITNVDYHEPLSIVKVDFDKDGKPDLVVGTRADVQVYLNYGKGKFAPEEVIPRKPGRSYDYVVAAGDIDLDGDTDVVLRRDTMLEWWEYDDEEFTKHDVAKIDLRAKFIVVGDLNGDGAVDIGSLKERSYGIDFWKNSSKTK